MLRRLINIALNPFFQAFAVAGFIILFLPLGLNKYTIAQADLLTRFDKAQFFFADLDHNGFSEKICTFYNPTGNVSITLHSGNLTLGQWNLSGIFEPGTLRFMTGDFNKDEFDEIYIFTLIQDSLMLQALAFSPKPEMFIKNRFITKIGENITEPDYRLYSGEITDMNHDGSGDLVFCVNAGHSKQPRNIFIYDIYNDTIRISPKSGSYINDLILEDIDGDHIKEILLSTYASSNFNGDPFEYSDTSSWLMVLDHDLNFLFTPVEFPGRHGGIRTSTYETRPGEIQLLCCATTGAPVINNKKWFLTDLQGNTILERTIKIDDPMYSSDLILHNKNNISETNLVMIVNQGFFKIDTSLNIIRLNNIKSSDWAPQFLDVDDDVNDEIILLDPDLENHIIYRHDFTNPITLNFPIQSTPPLLSVKLNGLNPPQLSVQGDQVWKLFDYGINPVWRFRFLIWFGIYLAVLAFIMMIRKLYSFQLKRRYETEKKIATLQLSSVKAQMEPHFIMNTINTIGSSIYRQKPDEAYQLLLNFSGMVRSLLLSSDKLTRSLKEELDFAKNYLELEKSRFAEVFTYSIQIEESIDPESMIPKMVVQLHTENALKHGLLPKKSGGFLDIAVTREQNYLIITITDNGIGRNLASQNISQSTGKGMKILAQLFETYNRHNKNQLRQEILDLYDENKNPAGTQVQVFVPVDFNAGIF